MVKAQQKFWDNKHFQPDELSRMSQHSVFVEQSMEYFPQRGDVLELGAGLGSDSIFLANHGYKVVATDFSQLALNRIPETENLQTKLLDLSEPFPFKNNTFDTVYAHLSLHYFNRQITQQIFDEIYRILKPGGVIAVLLNSKSDPEYGIGNKLEEDYFDTPIAGPKRYFSIDSLQPFIKRFDKLILDDKGSDQRRSHKEDLIRFIGRKIIQC